MGGMNGTGSFTHGGDRGHQLCGGEAGVWAADSGGADAPSRQPPQPGGIRLLLVVDNHTRLPPCRCGCARCVLRRSTVNHSGYRREGLRAGGRAPPQVLYLMCTMHTVRRETGDSGAW